MIYTTAPVQNITLQQIALTLTKLKVRIETAQGFNGQRGVRWQIDHKSQRVSLKAVERRCVNK